MLVYVSGPYSKGDIDANIEAAAQIAAKLWEIGHAVICPHTNTAHFDQRCQVTYEQYIDGDLSMIARCDALVMVKGWENSEGSKREKEYAELLSIPVYYAPDFPSLHPTEMRSPVQAQAFLEIIGRMYRIHLEKNADYSPANIMVTGEIGLVTRLWDKIARLLNLTGFRFVIQEPGQLEIPNKPHNEAIDDTYMDTAIYAIIGLLLRCGKWGH